MTALDLERRTRVFLSYSRRDREFAERLRDRLVEAGLDAYLDVHDVVKGEPWRERLRALIESADAVAFLISPDSVASDICDWEINEAELREKRLVPVVTRETPLGSIPQRLQRRNFTFLDTEAAWEREAGRLVSALREDAEWVREHTRLGELALRWERAGRPSRLLLRGADVPAAEGWRDRRPHGAPELSQLHVEFLHDSRAGAQRRLRAWLVGTTVLALLAVLLSTFAYRQRDLAVRSADLAERRAAALATDAALARADEGAVDEALLMLLDASTRYPEPEVPEQLLLALRDVTRLAAVRRTFRHSPGARAFHADGGIAVFEPEGDRVLLIDPATGDQHSLGEHRGEVIAAVLGEAGLFFLSATGALLLAPIAGGAAGPRHLASLAAAGDERPLARAPPTLRLSSRGDPAGERTVRLESTDEYRTELWRYALADGRLHRIERPKGLGRLIAVEDDGGYYWDEEGQRIRRLGPGGAVEDVDPRNAATRGITPCEQVAGVTSPAHLAAVLSALEPGLERIGCAGVYDELALMSARRALARGLMDEYFLFPAGASVDAARRELWLGEAMTRLGTLATTEPFAWHAGSARSPLVATAHADRILVLGPPDGRYLSPALPAGADAVVAELVTPEPTDGGGFHGAAHLSYSGPVGGRYEVVIVDLAARGRRGEGEHVAQSRPARAYWGSCGVERASQGDAPAVEERRFGMRNGDGPTLTVDLGDREVAIPHREVHCASVSARRDMLAVAADDRVTLYDLGASTRAPGASLEAVASFRAPGVRTVAFLGPDHETLVTTRDHQVTVWRPRPGRDPVEEVVYRSAYSVLFAEADPTGSRLLVWLGFGTADAMVRVVPVPATGSDWLEHGPYMLVGNPDVFFGRDGAVYRVDGTDTARLMPPVSLARLRAEAGSGLSPSCRPERAGEFRSSPCWRLDR